MYDVVQITGSLLVLAAFVAALGGRLQQSSYTYLAVNMAGSAALTVAAVLSREWGFILLESVWAAVSLWSMFRKSLGRPVAVSHGS